MPSLQEPATSVVSKHHLFADICSNFTAKYSDSFNTSEENRELVTLRNILKTNNI